MDRGATWVLAFVIALIAIDVGQLAYRFMLPTDGWWVYAEGPSAESGNWVYLRNLVGADSSLQFGDKVLAVDGQSVRDTATFASAPRPPRWRVGDTVEVTLIRDGQQIRVPVPVVRWTAAAWWRYNLLEGSVGSIGGVLLFLIGLFTFSRRPDLPSTRALLVLCAANLASVISSSLPDGLSVQFNAAAYTIVVFYSYAIFGTLIAPSLLTFTLHFPRSKEAILRRPILGYIPVAWGLLVALSVFVLNLAIVGWVSTLLMILASIVSLVHSGFTQRDAVSRAQMRWAVGGFVLALATTLLTFASAFQLITDPFWGRFFAGGFSFAFLIIGISLSIAVLRYRLFDIDVIIRRTLIYSALTAILAVVYFGGVALMQSAFVAITGQESPLAVVASTLAIAALFTPVRRRVQNVVDRRFFRRRYDAAQTVDQFARAVRDEVDMDRLRGTLLGVVEETMQPEHVSLWMRTR